MLLAELFILHVPIHSPHDPIYFINPTKIISNKICNNPFGVDSTGIQLFATPPIPFTKICPCILIWDEDGQSNNAQLHQRICPKLCNYRYSFMLDNISKGGLAIPPILLLLILPLLLFWDEDGQRNKVCQLHRRICPKLCNSPLQPV